MVISGDLELNPGPNNRNKIGSQGDSNVRASKCKSCYKTVRTNSKQLMGEHCKLLVHLNCANVNLRIENSKESKTLESSRVHFEVITSVIQARRDNYTNTCYKLQELKTHISICDLNA